MKKILFLRSVTLRLLQIHRFFPAIEFLFRARSIINKVTCIVKIETTDAGFTVLAIEAETKINGIFASD
ncbi:MAG: hypothetical protein PHZ00_00055 [Candidatus Peribacteraceae bacterium]|nr:hypothetical protein [Candidatus Peribacteraceae bacterium]